MKLRVGVLAVLVALAVPASAAEPVLLLHGLWGSAKSWKGYAEHLSAAGWNEGCLVEFDSNDTKPELRPAVGPSNGGNLTGAGAWTPEIGCILGPKGGRPFFRVVFRDNDGQTFEMQGRQVAAAVAKVRELTGAAKVTLVAHSMGGLAARAYVQSKGYRGDVSAIATVATPHMGSLLPYLVKEKATLACRIAARWLAGKNFNAPAVGMLAPDSAEMLALNLPGSPFGEMPAGLRLANVVADYEREGKGSCSPWGMSD